MRFESIENLIVRQKARTLFLEVCAAMEPAKDCIVKNRLLSTCIDITSGIAMAYEMPTRKELIKSLQDCCQLTGATRSLIHLSIELGLIEPPTHHKLIDLSLDVTKLLKGFIKKLKESAMLSVVND